MEVIDIVLLRESRRAMRDALASDSKQPLKSFTRHTFQPRNTNLKHLKLLDSRLANTALSYLVASGDPEWIKQASTQITKASNMTDVMAAMKALSLTPNEAFETELKAFYSNGNLTNWSSTNGSAFKLLQTRTMYSTVSTPYGNTLHSIDGTRTVFVHCFLH